MDWDARYQNNPGYVFGKDPARFLLENRIFLPTPGVALDVAVGEGRNAAYLARLGFRVAGIDLSKPGLIKASRLAFEYGVAIQPVMADLTKIALAPASLDLIVCINFLERRLLPVLMEALKPKGRLFMETYTKGQVKYGFGPSNAEHLLNEGELLDLFGAFRVVFYREHDNEITGAKAGIVVEKS
jgi:2-polyprenyl-3-methyl-5-hydroxy-6-metoxy-1,4-benzoquinol methylase